MQSVLRAGGRILKTSDVIALMMANARPYWRDAATVIVTCPVAEGRVTAIKGAYDVLMLKRGHSSTFMANMFVFPGGASSSADFDSKWRDIFQCVCGVPFTDIEKEVKIPGHRPPMMTKEPGSEDPGIPLELGFRICAIRETFEESGLLLVTHKDDFKEGTVSRGHKSYLPPNCWHLPKTFDHKSWRKKVETDPNEFHNLCSELQVVPNIWALYEWNNWLTPNLQRFQGTEGRKPKRFDTLFYVCCLEHRPDNVEADLGEISIAQWQTPEDWLSLRKTHEIEMGAPQVYELQRLGRLPVWQELHSFVQKREPLGVDRWMPVITLSDDGGFMILPGDELYPDSPDFGGTGEDKFLTTKGQLKELFVDKCDGRPLHRGISFDGHVHYLCNFKLQYEHIGLPETNAADIRAKL